VIQQQNCCPLSSEQFGNKQYSLQCDTELKKKINKTGHFEMPSQMPSLEASNIYTNYTINGSSCMMSDAATNYGSVSHCLNLTVNKTQTEQWHLNDLAKYLVLCEVSSQTKQKYFNLFWISTIHSLPSD